MQGNSMVNEIVNESVLVKTVAFRVILFKTGCGNTNWVTFL